MEKLPYINETPNSEGEWTQALIDMARYLRGPEGCPWDRKQSGRSFAEYLAGEVAELLEAYAEGDNAHIAEETGDCLFVLLASAVCAEEEGLFRLHDALAGIHEKMLRRHGHVFGEEKAASPEEALAAWNRVKAAERRAREEERG
jgi:tetrapyrrole methylase family protein / MazG family protein